MAIKDWKKIRSGKFGALYQKGKGEFVKVVYKPEIKVVSVFEDNNLEFEREFQTKQQAMAFAMKYMRTH